MTKPTLRQEAKDIVHRAHALFRAVHAKEITDAEALTQTRSADWARLLTVCYQIAGPGFDQKLLDVDTMSSAHSEMERLLEWALVHAGEIRRRKNEVRILRLRAEVDAMRPKSAEIDKSMRGHKTYRYPPKPAYRPEPEVTAAVELLTLDQALNLVRSMVETLPDETPFPSSFLNWPYRDLIAKGVPRIHTVGDLRPLSHEQLLALPKGGRRLILNQLRNVATANGFDVAFVDDPTRVIPSQPEMCALHALHRGFVLRYVQQESHTGRMMNCHRVYEMVDGTPVETERTAVYNETDGRIAGFGKWLKYDAFAERRTLSEGVRAYVISEAGRAKAEAAFGMRLAA